MAARYGTVSLTFWNDVKVRGWTDDGRVLALYLMTCPHRSFEGFYHLPLALASSDLGWSSERLTVALDELVSTDFCDADEPARVVFIVKALKYQQIRGRFSIQGALNSLSLVNGSPRLFGRLLNAADTYQPELAAEIRRHYDLPKGPYREPQGCIASTPEEHNPTQRNTTATKKGS